MAKSGFIYGNAPNVNSTAEILKKYNKMNGKSYWNTAYSEINKAYNNGLYQLDNAMADNMARQNYATMQAKNTAAQMNLGSGDLARYNTYYDNALEQAYNSYKSSYNDAVGELNTSIGKAYDAVNTELAAQSQNTVDLTNFGYDWLYDMANRKTSPLFTDNDEIMVGYDWLFSDEISEETGRRKLYSRSELNNLLYDENTHTLNTRGQQFYDMIFNGAFGDSAERYTDYLMQNNPELLEWASSINQYDDSGSDNWNYIKRNLMGVTDDKYLLGNYLKYMSETDRNNILFNSNDEQIIGLIANNDLLTDEQKSEYYRLAGVNPNTGKRISADDSDTNKFVKDNYARIRDNGGFINAYALDALNDDDALATRLKSDIKLTDGTGDVWYLEDKNSDEFKYVKQVINDVANDLLSNGDIIDLDIGGKTAYYMVNNGQLIPVKDIDSVNTMSITDVAYNKYVAYKKIKPDISYRQFVRSTAGHNKATLSQQFDVPDYVENVLYDKNGSAYYWDNDADKWIKAKRRKENK